MLRMLINHCRDKFPNLGVSGIIKFKKSVSDHLEKNWSEKFNTGLVTKLQSKLDCGLEQSPTVLRSLVYILSTIRGERYEG
jgi:hypothetical protein